MTYWAWLLFVALAIGSAQPCLALRSLLQQAQEDSAGSTSAQPSNRVAIGGEAVGPRMPARAGEICIVCNNPVGPDDAVYLVQGQRVAVHAGVEEREFLSHPRKYLMRLKPLGGALLGADSNQPGMANRAGNDQKVSGTWIYGGLYILLGLVFAAICAHRALHTGHSPVAWFGLGLFFNVVAYILLLTRPRGQVKAPAGVPLGLGKIAATHAPQRCPRCSAFNHPSAVRCLTCGASLSPGVQSEVRSVGLRSV